MRILHLGKYFPPHPGGMETFLGDLSRAQARAGHAVACVVHGAATGVAEQDGVRLYTARSHGQWIYAPVSPRYPILLRRALAEYKPELVHIHMPSTSAFWALANRRARAVPWVVHWQSDVVMTGWPRRHRLAYQAYRRPEQALLKRAAAIVATSPAYLEHSPSLQPWRDKCHVVSLGIDPERLQAVEAAAFDWSADAALRVLVVGRLSHYKGHDVLLRSLKQSGGVHALIVGSGEREEALRAEVERLELDKRVTFTGSLPQAQVNGLMRRCDVLCLPSVARSEAVGLVLLEAMALGKPVIAGNLSGSGMPWVVETAGHGLLTEPNDPASLANALEQIKDPGLREKLGRRGQQSFEETFHIHRIAARLQTLYSNIG